MNSLPLSTILACVTLPSAASATNLLPDPLRFADGSRVSTVAEWQERRRPELLELFRRHVYGRAPIDRPGQLRFEILEPETDAFEGLALRKQVRIAYAGPGGEGAIMLTCYFPRDVPPKGCFTLIVNRSRSIIDQAETAPAEFWPVRDLLARGYATAAFHYSDAAIDQPQASLSSGVFKLFGPPETERPDDAWGAISAWSWAASRVIDYLVTEERLKDTPLTLVGHSRGGKAALWCGAQDPRIALTISNDSGCTGAALARTTRGETIQLINEVFPHWFTPNYKTYAGRETELPVDQHELIALMAPRRVYVASASEDPNADPLAEFTACVEASPVFALHELAAVGRAEFPAIGETRHDGSIGYHLRAGEHDLTREDWIHFMDYADGMRAVR